MVFKSWWLDDNRYKDWLQRGDDPNTAKCRHCKGKPISLTKKFQLGALDSHAESEKHKAAIDNSKRHLDRKNFFGKSQASSSIAKSQASDSDTVVVDLIDVSETNEAELLPTTPADSSSQPSASSQSSSSSSQPSAKDMMNMFRSETREKSELTWILFSVDHNFSDRSSDPVKSPTFYKFPKSKS